LHIDHILEVREKKLHIKEKFSFPTSSHFSGKKKKKKEF
jgi:hypothetical protein